MTKSKRLQQTLDQISGAAAEVLRPTTPTLAQALRNSHNPDNLRCANRSWYGEEHDTACELEGKR